MKKLTRAIAGFLSAAIAVTSMATAAFANTENYNQNGDFATNGEFPETGVILNWGYYARPTGMPNTGWQKIDYNGYKYANKTSKANSAFHFETNGSTAEGENYWTGASTIKTGVLEVTNYVKVPEIKNELGEQYVQYFAIWGKEDDGQYYTESGNLYSVIMNYASELYIGFTTKDHHNAVSAKESTAEATQPGITVKVDAAEWYKLTAIINYDANTLDYYLNDKYVCSHENFAANSQYYQMASLFYSAIKDDSISNTTEVYVTGTKMERFKSSLSATASITSKNTASVKFDGEIKTPITNDTFALTDVDGNSYTIKSAVLNAGKKTVDITIGGTFKANEAVTVVANNEIESRIGTVMASRTMMVAAPLPADDAFINMNFNATSFPTDASSKAVTGFYVEYPQQTEHKSIASDFADAKAYLDNGDDYYMGYNYRVLKAVDDGNGGKALDFHRDDTNRTPNYWSKSATKTDQYTYGLVIPFSDGKSVNSGKINIEFDGGKVGTINADAYTIGLRDKNNPVTVFDKNSAWSNSTALFTFGDYYETATIIYKPQGRSAGYSYYAMQKGNSPSADTALWPTNPDSVKDNNKVRHYKIELDLDTKTYDIYQDSEKIGTSLSLPDTTNVAEYDAFVIGCGMDFRSEVVSKEFSFRLDNLVVARPDETSFVMESITNADGSSYTGNVVDNSVVFNFNMNIESADVMVGTTPVTPTISGKTVTVPLDGAGVGRTTITLSNVKSTVGKTIGEIKAPAVIPAPQMSGSFNETPDGLTLIVDDNGYAGVYTIYVAGYDAGNRLTVVEVITEKEANGIYALTKDFGAAASVKAFVWGENLCPFTTPIVNE